jgi:hypothetical protein
MIVSAFEFRTSLRPADTSWEGFSFFLLYFGTRISIIVHTYTEDTKNSLDIIPCASALKLSQRYARHILLVQVAFVIIMILLKFDWQ